MNVSSASGLGAAERHRLPTKLDAPSARKARRLKFGPAIVAQRNMLLVEEQSRCPIVHTRSRPGGQLLFSVTSGGGSESPGSVLSQQEVYRCSPAASS